MNRNPVQGIGLGLRFDHFDDILESRPKVPWFEVTLEDFLEYGPHHQKLLELRKDYPIVMHSIGLDLGGCDSYDIAYLKQVKGLYEKFQPEWISDHLCWSSSEEKFHHDLLPIPKSKEGLKNLCDRINYLQNFFNRTLVLENITSYVDFKEEEYEEIEFIEEVLKNTECYLLLDITNVLINHINRGSSYQNYFDRFPMGKVKQIHLSGHAKGEGILIDSHSDEVGKEDIHILTKIYKKESKIPAMIERDDNIPNFKVLNSERKLIEDIVREI